MVDLIGIAKNFTIPSEGISVKPYTGGLINTTYLVTDKNNRPAFILQKKNKEVFKDVPGMMDNILKISEHLRKKVIESGGNPSRNVMEIVSSISGKPYYQDENGEFWAVSVFIPDAVIHEQADTPYLAFRGGEAIGNFQLQLSDFKEKLHDTLPGFHDLKFRFQQWDKSLADDKAGRAKNLKTEISWIEERRKEMLDFWTLVEKGLIPKRVTHNDTKISNILFENDGKVACVIDLDTVMSNTVLADYGDAIRSFTNTAAEDEPELSKVGVNKSIYDSYTDGYLSKAESFLSDNERKWLNFAPRYITFEQTLRFLMDYIDGDTYYMIHYPKHNLVRAKSQHKLLESFENI